MPEPTDMIVPMLQEMRADIAGRFDQVDQRLDIVERRRRAIEGAQASFRQALSADSVLSKLVTGEFGSRIELLECSLQVLEGLDSRVERLEAGL